MTTHSLAPTPAADAVPALAASFAAGWNWIAHERRRAAALAEFARLDDAALRRIGLARPETGSIAAQARGDLEDGRLRPITRRRAKA